VEWEAPSPGRQIKPKPYLSLSNIVSINIHLPLDPVYSGKPETFEKVFESYALDAFDTPESKKGPKV